MILGIEWRLSHWARFSRPAPPFAQASPHDWDLHLARQRQSIAEFAAICEGMEDVLALVSLGKYSLKELTKYLQTQIWSPWVDEFELTSYEALCISMPDICHHKHWQGRASQLVLRSCSSWPWARDLQSKHFETMFSMFWILNGTLGPLHFLHPLTQAERFLADITDWNTMKYYWSTKVEMGEQLKWQSGLILKPLSSRCCSRRA